MSGRADQVQAAEQPDLFPDDLEAQKLEERRRAINAATRDLPPELRTKVRRRLRTAPDLELRLELRLAMLDVRRDSFLGAYLRDAARAERQQERARQVEAEAEACRARAVQHRAAKEEEEAKAAELRADMLFAKAQGLWQTAQANDIAAQAMLNRLDETEVRIVERLAARRPSGHAIVELLIKGGAQTVFGADETDNYARLSHELDAELREISEGSVDQAPAGPPPESDATGGEG